MDVLERVVSFLGDARHCGLRFVALPLQPLHRLSRALAIFG
jgi:hypothetical protein